MGETLAETLSEPARQRSGRTALIIVIVVLALVGTGVGVWLTTSRSSGPNKADVVRLDKERTIVDTSMNLYDPLVQQFTARYTNAVSEDAEKPEIEQVLSKEGEVLQRESRANLDRLEHMTTSPALQAKDVADAFGAFKEHYGAVIAYQDQQVINTVNITRSVGGPCAPLHTELNVASETYPEDYVKTADACLAALAGAKDKADAETVQLLTDIEKVIKEQRDKQQKAVEAKSEFERLALKTTAAVGLLDINQAFAKARTTYETTVKAKQTKLVEDANNSNKALETALKKSLESYSAASGGGN